MKFVKATVKKVDWPVTVSEPQDGGTVKKGRFTATFEILTQTVQDAATKQSDLLDRVLVGWGTNLTAEDGSPLEFNDENKAAVIDVTYFRAGLIAAYFQAASGTAAPEKN